MKEDQVLTQLRDIHVPADLGAAVPIAFAPWPFVILAIILGAALMVRVWTRVRRRQQAGADLARIVGVEDPAEQWGRLLAFAGGLAERMGRRVTLPDLAYRRPETITDADRAAFIEHLHAELRR